jgi:hypothetical protein
LTIFKPTAGKGRFLGDKDILTEKPNGGKVIGGEDGEID